MVVISGELAHFARLVLTNPFCDSKEKQMMVYVERKVVEDGTLSDDQLFGSICNQLCTFREGGVLSILISTLASPSA